MLSQLMYLTLTRTSTKLSKQKLGIIKLKNSKKTCNSFDNWDQYFSKKTFLAQNRKNNHHYRTLHIRINLGTTFNLKMRVLYILNQICSKGVFLV